jgi:hypothetical protein
VAATHNCAGDGGAFSSTASEKEKHEFLVSVLKESRYGLIDFMFKHAAILTLFLGWIVTSEPARRLLSSGMRVCLLGSFLILVYAAVFGIWATAWRNRSIAAYTNLVDIGYMPLEYYAPLRISNATLASFIGIHWAVCVFAAVGLFLVAGVSDPVHR